MTPEQFKYWSMGMSDAAAICQNEADIRHNKDSYATMYAEELMAKLIFDKISRRVQEEIATRKKVETIIQGVIDPSHKEIVFNGTSGPTCKICGSEGVVNLMKPCTGKKDADAPNYEADWQETWQERFNRTFEKPVERRPRQ